jgi:hypothetical protein
MITLESFNSYYSLADLKLDSRSSSMGHEKDYQADLNLVKDMMADLMPGLMMQVFEFLNFSSQVKLSKDRTSIGFNTEIQDKDAVGGDREFAVSLMLESDQAFTEEKKDFKLLDFDNYVLRIESNDEVNDLSIEAPRIFGVRGSLMQGKYHPDLIKEFSYEHFNSIGEEDGRILYITDSEGLKRNYGSVLPEESFEGGTLVLDIDRPFADFKEDAVTRRQVLLFPSGKAFRSI